MDTTTLTGNLNDALDDLDALDEAIATVAVATSTERDQLLDQLATACTADLSDEAAIGAYVTRPSDADEQIVRWAALTVAVLAVTLDHKKVWTVPLPGTRPTRSPKSPLPPMMLVPIRMAARRGRVRMRIVGLLEAGVSQTEMAALDGNAVRPGWPPQVEVTGTSRTRSRVATAPIWAAAALEKLAGTDAGLLGDPDVGLDGRVATVGMNITKTIKMAGLRPWKVTGDTIRHTVAAGIRDRDGLEAAADFLGLASLDRTRQRLAG